MNPNIVSADEIRKMVPLERDGDIIRWLEENNIHPFTHGGKLVMVTIQQLNEAKGIGADTPVKSSDIL